MSASDELTAEIPGELPNATAAPTVVFASPPRTSCLTAYPQVQRVVRCIPNDPSDAVVAHLLGDKSRIFHATLLERNDHPFVEPIWVFLDEAAASGDHLIPPLPLVRRKRMSLSDAPVIGKSFRPVACPDWRLMQTLQGIGSVSLAVRAFVKKNEDDISRLNSFCPHGTSEQIIEALTQSIW